MKTNYLTKVLAIFLLAALLGAGEVLGLDLQKVASQFELCLDWTRSDTKLSGADFSELERLSSEKNPLADFALGVCKLRGVNTEPDKAAAAKLFERAALKKNPQAINAYAICLKYGLGVDVDKERASKLFKEAAELGNLSAVASRGFELAHLKDKDAAKTGIVFLESAAKLGCARAEALLGMCYANSLGVKSDLKKAAKLFKSAADKGSEIAPFCEARSIELSGDKSRYTEAFRLYKASAKSGYPQAMAHLGACYMYSMGTEQNFEEAIKCLKQAADMGVAQAMNDLGVCYANSIGVDEESAVSESIKMFSKAAEFGDSKAQNNLANYYYYGTVIPRDYKKAFYWYSKAANQGDAPAQSSLALLYLEGLGVEKNAEIAISWLKPAAESGDVEAQSNLGKCYLEGIGTSVNYAEAVKWLELAAASKDSNALANLGACYYRGLGVEKDAKKGRALIAEAAKLGNEEAERIIRLLPEE